MIRIGRAAVADDADVLIRATPTYSVVKPRIRPARSDHLRNLVSGTGAAASLRYRTWARPRTSHEVDKGQWVGDSAVDQPPDTVGDDEMIMLCERCCTPIAEGDPVVRYAHIDKAHSDGSIDWVHSYVHTTRCLAPRTAPHERPDTGEWDPTRGVGVHRS